MKRLIVLILLISASTSFSQKLAGSPREALYQALDIYSLGRYDEAYEKFKLLSEIYPREAHHSIFKFMSLKSLFKAGHLDPAKNGFEKFTKDYPGSNYLDAANMYLGHIAYLQGRLLESAIYYIKARDISGKSRAGEIAAANLKQMLPEELSIDDLIYIVDNYPRSDFAEEALYNLGKRHYDDQRFKSAATVCEKYLANYSFGNHTAGIKQLYAKAREKCVNKIIIGVLAPISGSYADYGKEMVNGIKLAFADASVIDNKEIELIIKDTQGTPVQAVEAMKSLIQEEPAIVIGPLRSESAVSAAILANFNSIPLITPTASEPGIAELGDNIFQLSPSAEKIATCLAEYAVNDLGIKEFGIIAPGDFNGRQVARAFRQKVYQLGGEVITNAFYEPGETDFSHQIKPLREHLLMKTEEQLATGLIDSSDYFDEEKEIWLEQEDWRVHLGGLFLPGYQSELAQLVPQTRYHIISTQYLGLDGWDSPELAKEISRYIDGSIFATDYHPGAENNTWNDFHTHYRELFGSEPGRVAALSHDAAELVKSALQKGSMTADAIGTYLGNVEDYKGVSCTIDFKSTGHANDAVSIFRIGAESLTRLR